MLMIAGGCDRETGTIKPVPEGPEQQLMRSWTYESVAHNDIVVEEVWVDFEPTPEFRISYPLNKRHVRYTPQKTYQIFWSGEEYSFGSGPNYQPGVGFWSMKNDSLIHNSAQFYQKSYKIIELSETRFVRQSTEFPNCKGHACW